MPAHAVKAYGGVEAELNSFLKTVLREGKWAAARYRLLWRLGGPQKRRGYCIRNQFFVSAGNRTNIPRL